jgi:hypothetical protein
MKYKVELSPRARYYYFNGKLHREDGPAIERVFNGVNTVSYILKNQFMNKNEFDLIRANKEKSWLFNEK